VIDINANHQIWFIKYSHHDSQIALSTPYVQTSFTFKPFFSKHFNLWVSPPIFKRLEFDLVAKLIFVALMNFNLKILGGKFFKQILVLHVKIRKFNLIGLRH